MRFCARAKAHFIGAFPYFSRFSGFALQKGPISAVRGRGYLPHGEARASLSGSAECMARTSSFQRVFCRAMRPPEKRCSAGRWISAERFKNSRKSRIFMISFGIHLISCPHCICIWRAPLSKGALSKDPLAQGGPNGRWRSTFLRYFGGCDTLGRAGRRQELRGWNDMRGCGARPVGRIRASGHPAGSARAGEPKKKVDFGRKCPGRGPEWGPPGGAAGPAASPPCSFIVRPFVNFY